MAISKNQPLVKNHFRKHWQERVRVHLDQAGKRHSRRVARAAKAAKLAPRPTDALRPIVRCPTLKYNRKVRAGRGFTVAEIRGAGAHVAYARSVGVAVDLRRQNKSQETFDANVARLKEYLSKVVVLEKKTKVPALASVAKTFPISQPAPESAPRAVQVPAETAFETLRKAREEKKFKGKREKEAKEAAEAEAEKKKK